MNRAVIIDGIKREKGARIAELQKKYNITYREAKGIVDELVAKGVLVYGGGLKYDLVVPPAGGTTQSVFRGKKEEWKNYTQEMYEEDDDEEDEETKTRIKALRLCIQSGVASTVFLQRSLPTGYIMASKIIDWMEHEGYITAPDGPLPRKVLITEEQFEKTFNLPVYDDETEGQFDLFDNDDEEFDSLFDDDDYDDDDEDVDVDTLLAKAKQLSDEAVTLAAKIQSEIKTGCLRLADVLRQIAAKKAEEEECEPEDGDILPEHPSWPDEEQFLMTVEENIKLIVTSDKKMGVLGAINKARAIHWEFNDLGNKRMEEVFERVVYELEHTSSYMYAKLKKKYFC